MRLTVTFGGRPANGIDMQHSTRTVIVTGASRGIGRATAVRLAEDFDTVVLVARSQDGLAECADEIEGGGGRALVHPADLRLPGAAAEVIGATVGATGGIDAIANVAGAVPQANLMTLTDEEWDDGLAMKFHGARRLALAGWEHLKASQGAIVFVSGATAAMPSAALAAVSTVNAAISAMAKAFADQGLVDNVRVNAVLPGAVMTSRRMAMIERYAAARNLATEDAVAHYTTQAGIARFGRPEEIAELIAFALSPATQWMTGTTLRMDGGETRAL